MPLVSYFTSHAEKEINNGGFSSFDHYRWNIEISGVYGSWKYHGTGK